MPSKLGNEVQTRLNELLDSCLSNESSNQLGQFQPLGMRNTTRKYKVAIPGFPLSAFLAYLAYNKFCLTDSSLPRLRYRHFLLLSFLMYMADNELLSFEWKYTSKSNSTRRSSF